MISFQLDATPIWGLAKSSSPMPTARSMPRAAARSSPSVTSRERGLMSGVACPSVMATRVVGPGECELHEPADVPHRRDPAGAQ